MQQFTRSACKHDVTALASSIRAYINNVVGLKHHFLVVLNHKDRVAVVAESFKGVDEPLIISLVQADRRLIQYIEHIDQT